MAAAKAQLHPRPRDAGFDERADIRERGGAGEIHHGDLGVVGDLDLAQWGGDPRQGADGGGPAEARGEVGARRVARVERGGRARHQPQVGAHGRARLIEGLERTRRDVDRDRLTRDRDPAGTEDGDALIDLRLLDGGGDRVHDVAHRVGAVEINAEPRAPVEGQLEDAVGDAEALGAPEVGQAGIEGEVRVEVGRALDARGRGADRVLGAKGDGDGPPVADVGLQAAHAAHVLVGAGEIHDGVLARRRSRGWRSARRRCSWPR
jgi:hypothetical protein